MNRTQRIRAALATTVLLAFAGAAAAQSAPVPTVAPQPVQSAPSPAPKPAATDLRAEPVPPQVDAVFKAWDTNHDGTLTLAEFHAGWRNIRRGDRQTTGMAGLRQQFGRIDADDSGGIERDEYPNLVLVKRAGAQAPPFSEVDRNHDGKLDFAEYSELVRRLQTAGHEATPSPK